MRLFWMVQWIVAHIPVVVGNFVADRAGDIGYYAAKRSRCVAESNMRHVLPPDTPDRVVRQKVHQIFRVLARNYYDLLRAHSMTDAQIDRVVSFDEASWKPVQELLDHHKGMMIVTAHYGAFDMVAQVLARRGLPLLLMLGRTKPYVLSDFLTLLRTERGLREVNLETGLGAIKTAMQALRSGDMVGIFADRNLEATGITIPFFGHDAVMAAGMPKMAVRSKVPVVGIFCHRHGSRYVVKFEPPLYPPTGGSEAENLREFTRTVFRFYEKHIGRHPEQWVLLQPVWPDSACGPDPTAAT